MVNLARYVEYHSRLRPSAEAIVYGDTRISWKQLEIRVRETAAGLAALNVGSDTVVAIIMKNSAAYIECLYAIGYLGGVVLPVNFRLAADEVQFILEHAGAQVVLVDAEFSALVPRPGPTVVTFGPDAQHRAAGAFADTSLGAPSFGRRKASDLFRIMYTSGTTDRPKGVVHTYDNFYWKSLDHIIALQLTAESRICIVGPLYHVGACDLPGLGVHIVGGTIIVHRDFDPASVMHSIGDERVIGIWMAPVMTGRILSLEDVSQFDVSSLRWCIGGGEKTPESRIRRFCEVFPHARYIDAYGMTETGSGDTFMDEGREIEKIGSVGRPVGFVDIDIRDDCGNSLPPGVEGEICMHGKKVSERYYRDDERTRLSRWSDGYLRSGDVGYLDEEGFLYLTDRKKDMIISGGENVSSAEIERVIYGLTEVEEVAVVGRPDDRWGEVPIAVVVFRGGASLTFETLRAHCQQQLADFKCPKGLVVVDRLPRNPSGKILKNPLRDLVRSV
ncbi:MAG: AMP-binding protein [Dehalococcoidia bacterium]